ncbi:MAG: hypothetical protein AAGA89_07440 [Pseudomonadota bacterium]
MKPRAAALALAAPLLFAAPALADHGKAGKRVTGSISVQTGNGDLHFGYTNSGHGTIGYTSHRHHGYNGYQSNRQAKRQAIRACRQAIRRKADYLGFRDVDFDDGRYAEQIGPRGFRVTFNEVEFETRRRDIERPVTCIVRRGDQVREIHGIPQRGHNRGHYGY